MAEEESTQGRRKQRRGTKLDRRSAVWKHFILFTDDHGNEKARCKRCGQVLNASQGTSSPKKHVKICPGQGAATGVSEPPLCDPPRLAESSHRQPIPQNEADDHEPGLNHKEASMDLARMIALRGYDPSFVEDDYFKSFVRRLNPQFEVPSHEAIEEMCSDIFQESRSDMYRSNKDEPGQLSLAVGEAKTIKTGQVVYITTHFIDHHWNLHRLVEDVYMDSSAGDYYHVLLQGVPVMDSLDDVVDRIAINDTFSEYELFMVAAGEMTGHINYFELKDFFEQKLEKKIYSATFMDHVLHSIARCLLPDSDFVENIFSMVMECLKHNNVAELRDLRHESFGLAKIDQLDDPSEYDERWYSCYCSLEILDDPLFFDSDTEPLLCTLWREIYRAIKRVSDSSRPTSNLCLQELFKVRHVLQSQLSKAPDAAHADNYIGFGNKSVTDVLREALETVYKAIQDSYLVWSIPLILDPRYKLRYIKFIFENEFGSEAEKYVSEVRTKTEDLYTSYIKADDEDSGGIIEEMAIDSTHPLEKAWDEQCRSQDETWKVDSRAEAKRELDCYLEGLLTPGTEDFDILDWWKQNGVKYPTVARMARDALAMPTCSKLTSDQIAQVKSMLRGYYDGYL